MYACVYIYVCVFFYVAAHSIYVQLSLHIWKIFYKLCFGTINEIFFYFFNWDISWLEIEFIFQIIPLLVMVFNL